MILYVFVVFVNSLALPLGLDPFLLSDRIRDNKSTSDANRIQHPRKDAMPMGFWFQNTNEKHAIKHNRIIEHY